MLYVFCGPDIAQSHEKSQKLIGSLRAKKPDAAFEQVTADNWSSALIENHLGGQGLFSNKYIVLLDRVTENEEAKEKLADFNEPMNESPNIFIVLEGKLNADLKKSFEKYAAKVVVSSESSVNLKGSKVYSGKPEFNVFALGDAVGSRDGIKAWAVYRQAVDIGLESEGILGTLFWQVKSMIMARDAKSAGESGLSPFVFSKSKRYAENYSEVELRNLLSGLITLYHDGHRGLRDLELATERLMLGVGRGV
jgi:DNA polymerase III delta subunit